MVNASFNLSDLDGSNGFVINGVDEFDYLGEEVSEAGDINGDGIADLIIGAPRADTDASNSGVSYVVFGSTTVGLGGSFDLSDLDGTNGFVINNSEASDFFGLGRSVSSVGDINNDGIDDLIVGASGADPNGSSSGASYVLFGDTTVGLGGSFDLSNLNGSNGFVINGVDASDSSGSSVSSAGDINGDGIDDLIIGAPGVDANGNSAGASYVLFGGTTVGLSGSFNLSELDGSNGFVINGIELGGELGSSVSSAGDINGDGIGDLIIGVPGFGLNNSRSGTSYVVFGGTTIGLGGSFDLSNLDGSSGFVINGFEALDRLGETVSSAGDVNGDGIDDLIIAAPGVDTNGISYGTSYVLFGGTTIGLGGSFDLSNLNGSNGFVIDGVDAFDDSGFSVRVSGAGDINNDGIADLMIGTPGDLGDGSVSGSSYVVFGGTTLGAGGSFNLSGLNGSNGFRLVGINVGDSAGYSVSGAGDINSDGITDLIIGAPSVDANGSISSGASYVVFGSATQEVVPSAVNDFAITTINTPVTINVLTNDALPNDTLQPIAFETTSTNGGTITLDDNGTLNDLTDDQLLYTPAEGFVGSDRFSYGISDGSGGLLTATVNVAVFTTIGTFNDDTISGSSNPDWFLGKAGNDTLEGFAGNDGLFGYTGNDTLIGASGNDWLRGGVGDDVLDGGIGNDRLVGGEGNDTLTGGSGSDRFLFQVGQGIDTITDFEDGVDYFLLAGGLTFEQLDISQSNNDTLISMTSNGEVLATLNGVSASLITQTDFLTI